MNPSHFIRRTAAVVVGDRACFLAVFAALILLPANASGAEPTNAVGRQGLDVVVLTDGRRLEGSLLNERFELLTPYARLVFNKSWLSELVLSGQSAGFHSLVTVNGDRLSGLVAEKVLTLALAPGGQTEIRREKVTRILFGRGGGDGKTRGSPGRWFQLKNGDTFSGDFVSDRLVLVTERGAVEIKTAELTGLEFANSEPSMTAVSLADGRTLQGRLDTEDIEVRMDPGPQFAIHPQSVAKISARGKEPTAPPVAAGDGPSSLGHTNLEGLVWIPAGQFVMGSPPEEPGRDADEGPQTRVTISKGYWMGKYEVSQAEFQQVMGANPSHATGDPKRPVEKVTWYEATEYCQKLTQQEETRGRLPDGFIYRLPTEAEWEYACRAGTLTRFSYDDDKNETQLGDYAWYARNSESMTHPVGTRRPNPWGLYDMHGNVWEWCLDRWEGKYPGGAVTNFPVVAKGNLRVARGGSWLYEAKGCRSSNRDDYAPENRCSDLGFRVVLAPADP